MRKRPICRQRCSSAALVTTTWAHFSPARFHAFDAATTVTEWAARRVADAGVGHVPAPVHERGVHLVGHHPRSATIHHLAQRGELVPFEGPTGRVLGVAEQHRAGPGSQRVVDAFEVERAGALGVDHRHLDGPPAGQRDHVEERRVRRRRQHHVAVTAELGEGDLDAAQHVGDVVHPRRIGGPAVAPGDERRGASASVVSANIG